MTNNRWDTFKHFMVASGHAQGAAPAVNTKTRALDLDSDAALQLSDLQASSHKK